MIRSSGFVNVIPLADALVWNGALVRRVEGQHGIGSITKLTGTISGYVITQNDERLYIAGDTVWCKDVEQTLDRFRPTQIILNGGVPCYRSYQCKTCLVSRNAKYKLWT
jgi:hypothetical protein